MAKHWERCLQQGPRSEMPNQRAPDQSAELDHQAKDSPDSSPLANRIKFAIGTAAKLTSSLQGTPPSVIFDYLGVRSNSAGILHRDAESECQSTPGESPLGRAS